MLRRGRVIFHDHGATVTDPNASIRGDRPRFGIRTKVLELQYTHGRHRADRLGPHLGHVG